MNRGTRSKAKLYGKKKRTRRSYKWPSGRYAALRKTARSLVPVYRSISPFPQSKMVRHRYVENVSFGPAGVAGQGLAYTFSANSLYDPNVSGVGHQPMFRDEMAARYKYYTVIASYITVTWDQSQTAQANRGILCTISSSPYSSVGDLIEQFGYNNGGVSGTSFPLIDAQRNLPFINRNSYNAKKWYKTTYAGLMADDNKKTAAGSNPSENILYYVHQEPLKSTTTLAAQVIQVEITYIAVWREPQNPVAS